MRFNLAILLLITTAFSAFAQETDQKLKNVSIKPLIAKYCLECHSADDPNGDVQLDKLSDKLAQGEDAEAWHAALDVINAGDMPPDYADQPNAQEREQIVSWITNSLAKAADAKKQTHKTSVRRLTREQYTNTLQNLLGVKVDFGEALPADSKSEMGFRNSGEVLQTSSLHLDYYEKIARAALGKAIAIGDRPDSVHYRITFGSKIDSSGTGTEIGGFQHVSIPNDDFLVEQISQQAMPERQVAEPTKKAERKPKRKRRESRKQAQPKPNSSNRINEIAVGMRGSDNDRFRITKDGLVLFSAVPHVETAPKSWQGPSPNMKLLFKNSFPTEGDILVRVNAARSNNWASNRTGFISLREQVPATPTADTIRLKAVDCKTTTGLKLKDNTWLMPEDPAGNTTARFKIEVPESGTYQFDFVHPYAENALMPSYRLQVGRSRQQERLQIDDGLKDESEITQPMTLAFLEKGTHRVSIGGRFFVGFKELMITPVDATAQELAAEDKSNRNAYESEIPSLRVFAGARTDDGMDYRTFDSSKLVEGFDGRNADLGVYRSSRKPPAALLRYGLQGQTGQHHDCWHME